MNREQDKPKLFTGAAEIDITPPAGIHMAGDACRYRPVEKVLDPLYGRAFVCSNQGRKDADTICILALDLCTPGDSISDEIRSRIASKFGLKKEAIILHLLQNHSAPSLGTHLLLTEDSPYVNPELWWAYQGDPNYAELLLPQLEELVAAALSKMEPVEMACSGIADGRIAYNRRFLMRDGWVQTQPEDLSEILQPEGPADPEVGIACFRNRAGVVVAALLHHTAHPVSHFGKPWVSAGWPGAWARRMKSILGKDCVTLVLNGCCGNVNRFSPLVPQEIDDDTAAGRLAASAQQALSEAQWQPGGKTAYAGDILSIPFGDIENVIGRESVDHARALMQAEPEPRWMNKEHTAVDIEWLFAAVTLDILRRLPGRTYDYEIQVFRIGGLAVVGLIGEPFVEGQLQLKLASPAARTFVAHMCNGWIGYIPPRASYEAKNFNFRTSAGQPVRRGANLFLLEPDALDKIISKSAGLVAAVMAD